MGANRGEISEVYVAEVAAKDPMTHHFARDMYVFTQRATSGEDILPNGMIIQPTVHPRGIGLPELVTRHVTDVLIDQSVALDDRFRDVPQDLLKAFAQTAFKLGSEYHG